MACSLDSGDIGQVHPEGPAVEFADVMLDAKPLPGLSGGIAD